MIFLLLISLFSFSFITSPAFSSELPLSQVISGQRYEPSSTRSHVPLRERILVRYQKWKGTTYLFGGTTHYGVDCSSLMQHLFREAASLSLPRTTGEQIHRGVPVSEYRLQAGDLIFFRTGMHLRHVGVYIGNNQFIHASKSEGVTVSMLSHYWQARYITARRVAEGVDEGDSLAMSHYG